MQKIPTLFRRDPEKMSRVLPEINPVCQWVLDGDGVATRKYNGTCVLFDGIAWRARREVKRGKPAPHFFRAVQQDPNTGKTMGWEPIEQSSFAQYHAEAVQRRAVLTVGDWLPGTYELIGPKINGNPEHAPFHMLVRHEAAQLLDGVPRDYVGLVAYLAGFEGEGIVWHHPDGRMAKLKRRDFR